jgi:hypothetical protein
MVMHLANAVGQFSQLLAAQTSKPVLEQLDPPRRAAVLMALLGLVLLGMLLVVCVMIGGHWVRRMARHRPGAAPHRAARSAEEDRRLRAALASVLPDVKTDDTLHLGKGAGDTKMDL